MVPGSRRQGCRAFGAIPHNKSFKPNPHRWRSDLKLHDRRVGLIPALALWEFFMSFWKSAKDQSVLNRLEDEEVHAAALREIDAGIRRDGLWAKAAIESNGDEKKTKIAYMKLLVQMLRDEKYMESRVAEQVAERERASDAAFAAQEASRKAREQKSEATLDPQPRLSADKAFTTMERPNDINLAMKCLWATLVFGFMKLVMDSEFIFSQVEPLFAILIMFIVAVLSAFIFNSISQGRNWARITYLVLTLIGFPMSVSEMMSELGRSPVIGLISAVSIVLTIFALWLVFTMPGSAWFRRHSQ